jgi:uncharacterized protein YndB with AHSA1/START domain
MATILAVPDRIEKQTLLKAPLAKVWQAISDSARFGAWFGARFEGPFVAGATVKATIVPTSVDPEVAKLQESHAGVPFEVLVERVEPERLLAFRWYPMEFEPGIDLATAPTTLVTFELEEVRGGVRLTITESGFDRVPLAKRAEAYEQNEGGWEHQAKLIEKYLAAKS